MRNVGQILYEWLEKHKETIGEVPHDVAMELYRDLARREGVLRSSAARDLRNARAQARHLCQETGTSTRVQGRLVQLAGGSWNAEHAAKLFPADLTWDDSDKCFAAALEDPERALELSRLLPATALQGLHSVIADTLELSDPPVEHPRQVAGRIQRLLRTYRSRVCAAAGERAADAAALDTGLGSLGSNSRGFGSGESAEAWVNAYEAVAEDPDRDTLLRKANEACVKALLLALEANWTSLVPNDY